MDGSIFLSLLNNGESDEVEFKREFPEHNKDMAKEMTAFANTKGGFIFFGVCDDKDIVGVLEPDELLLRITNVARDSCEPPINLQLGKLQIGNKWIVWTQINREIGPFSVDGRYYIRMGPSVRIATNQEIHDLFIPNTRFPKELFRPRDYLYLDAEGIDRLYVDYLGNPNKTPSDTIMAKLQELLNYLATFKGKDFYEKLQEAVIGCSTIKEGVYIHIRHEFDAPQFINFEDGIAEVNTSKSVSFGVGFSDPYDYDDGYFKQNFRMLKIVMLASLDKWPLSHNGMTRHGHDATFLLSKRGKNLPLGIFGYLYKMSEYAYQIKPYAIRVIG